MVEFWNRFVSHNGPGNIILLRLRLNAFAVDWEESVSVYPSWGPAGQISWANLFFALLSWWYIGPDSERWFNLNLGLNHLSESGPKSLVRNSVVLARMILQMRLCFIIGPFPSLIRKQLPTLEPKSKEFHAQLAPFPTSVSIHPWCRRWWSD